MSNRHNNVKPQLLWKVCYMVMQQCLIGTFMLNKVNTEQTPNPVSLAEVTNNNTVTVSLRESSSVWCLRKLQVSMLNITCDNFYILSRQH